MAPARATNAMLTLDLGQPQKVFTLGTFFVNVRFPISDAVSRSANPLPDSRKEIQKRLVFLLSPIDLSRQRAKRRP